MRPLDGITRFSRAAVAAPFATALPIWRGVIKIERPEFGDFARPTTIGARQSGIVGSPLQGSLRSTCSIRKRRPYSAAMERADVSSESAPVPGAAGKQRTSASAAAALRVRISAWRCRTLRPQETYDLLVRRGGVLASPHGFATKSQSDLDIGTALHLYSSVLAALYNAERHGKGTESKSRCSGDGRMDSTLVYTHFGGRAPRGTVRHALSAVRRFAPRREAVMFGIQNSASATRPHRARASRTAGMHGYTHSRSARSAGEVWDSSKRVRGAHCRQPRKPIRRYRE